MKKLTDYVKTAEAAEVPDIDDIDEGLRRESETEPEH